jgi:hypothetical protein
MAYVEHASRGFDRSKDRSPDHRRDPGKDIPKDGGDATPDE